MTDNPRNSGKKRFLIVSPMRDFGPFLPISISLIIAILKKNGFEIKLFDTTFYKIPVRDEWKDASTEIGIFKPVNWDGYRMDELKEDYIGDFKEIVKTFNPDIIGISIFTTFNEKISLSLIDAIGQDFKGKVIVGGIHTFINLSRVKKYKKISAIITGECEDMLIKAIDFIGRDKKNTDCDIPNLIYKDENNLWVDSGKTSLSDFENIPFLNWDYFDDRNFYRPFEGKILRMGHVEMARGCPFGCTYCINEKFHKEYKNFWRVKSVKRMLEEIYFLQKKYKLGAVKFWDDDFLAMDIKKISAVTEGLKKMSLKFLCHSRPEHMNKEKIKTLSENGCLQIGVGVESGNPEYRKKMLKRKMSNESIIEAFKNCRKHKIISSAYCMIGMPEETREDIIATAKLLRQAKPHVIVHAIFAPYEGNSLYDYAREKGYVADEIDYENTGRCFMKMPSVSASEIENLFKVFIFYSRFGDCDYPRIQKAEEDSHCFRELKKKLSRISR